MDKLCEVVEKNGFTYTRIADNDKGYCYKQRYPGGPVVGYEVFLKKVSKEREVFGKLYPEREVFPADKDFGKTAWSYYSEKRALEALFELGDQPCLKTFVLLDNFSSFEEYRINKENYERGKKRKEESVV